MKNGNHKGRVWGIATAVVGLVLLALFNENLASFFEETGFNHGWTKIEPTIRIIAARLRFLGHPIMTHVYAFIIGVTVGVLVLRAIVRASQEQSEPHKPLTLVEVVTYLREVSAWAAHKGYLSDRDVELTLIDALAHGQLQAFAREKNQFGQPSPLQPIAHSYFAAVVIDMEAIKARRKEQIVLKTGYYADEFEDWQFSKAQVESLWPPEKKAKT